MNRVSMAVLMLLCLAILSQAEVTDQQAKSIAETATRVADKLPSSALLRAHRREDIEDDLFRFQIKVQGRIRKYAYFYEVTGDATFVISPTEAVVVTSSNGPQIKLVAVSVEKGEPYTLYRFENAPSEFNKLVRDANVKISDLQDARAFARLYFTLVEDPLSNRLMFSSLQLKHGIEDYFFFHYGEKKAKRLFHKWWTGFSSSNSRYEFDPLASETSAGFEAKLATIKGSTTRIPQLDEWTLQISRDGASRVKGIQTIYPTKGL